MGGDLRMIKYILCALLGYFAGCFSPSYLLSRRRGFDIRTFGSGNAGATNMMLAAGLKPGLIVMALDVSKAFVVTFPLAAGAWIHLLGWEMNPMFGAAAMSLSSFCVVTNALRLNLFRIRSTKHDHKRKNHAKQTVVPAAENHKNHKEENPMEKTMKIEGMMCGHCEARVKKCLEALPGVEKAEVSYVSGTAVLTLSAPVDDALLKKTVEDQGYQVI